MGLFFASLGWIVITYLLGALPFGLFVAKACKGIDPRMWGSGNTGATNVARSCGPGYGILTFALDAGKGFVPLLVAMAMSDSGLFLFLTALAALLGHMYSVFLNWKGGKGVATYIGIFAALSPGPLFWALILCLLLIWITGYVSLGSLGLVTVLPVFVLFTGQFIFFLLGILALFLIYSRHKENILRLARGQENPWSRKKFLQAEQ
ncbi:MAG: glycerol-3-phosphate 1-O-acyltransferase PlsY [Desulfohalobiaceae bacterium]